MDEVARDQAISQAVDRAQVLFRLFGWEWLYPSTGVPSRQDMEATLGRLLDTVSGDIEWAGTGRFVVRRDSEGETEILLSLAHIYSPE